jgi:hypothetical protein
MARNKLAGTKKGKSKSAQWYHKNPDGAKKRDAYNKNYHSSPARRAYRTILQAINRKKGTHGNHDGVDEAHQSSKSKDTKPQNQSENRADKLSQYFGKKKKK